MPIILAVLKKNGIGTWLIIGGNDSAETGHSLSLAAAGAGQPLAVVNVPKTIDNDLVLMDHCPGYGSAARFIARATLGAGRDADSMVVAGANTAWNSGPLRVTVTGGSLEMVFRSQVADALIAGIEVRSVPVVPPDSPFLDFGLVDQGTFGEQGLTLT